MDRDSRGSATGELIEGVLARVREQLRGADVDKLTDFVHQYSAQAIPGDLAESAVHDLYVTALSHWQFLQHFAGGAAALPVIKPRIEEHGWQAPPTVIETVNDDMPFLATRGSPPALMG